jgi:hypothetical protein
VHPRFIIAEANVVDATALPPGSVLHPAEILLGVAGDLHWCPSGNKVLGDVLPVASTKRTQTIEEIPTLRQGSE